MLGASISNSQLNAPVERFFFLALGLSSEAKTQAATAQYILTGFQEAFAVEPAVAIQLLFWIRDPRGGIGYRDGFRMCLRWLAQTHPDLVKRNLRFIPEFGRWDDLTALFNTSLEDSAAKLWSLAIEANDLNAAKWADREMKPLQRACGFDSRRGEADLRKLLSRVRGDKTIESAMCQQQWDQIDYDNVPAQALTSHHAALKRHNKDRFQEHMSKQALGRAAIHASILRPHDCVRTAQQGDAHTADAQFAGLPPPLSPARTVVVCCISSTVKKTFRIDYRNTCLAWSLYFSNQLPAGNPLHRLVFSQGSRLEVSDWRDKHFSEAAAVSLTRLVTFDLAQILADLCTEGMRRSAKREHMPEHVVVVSDTNTPVINNADMTTAVTNALQQWDNARFVRPSVVCWNLGGYDNPAAINQSDLVRFVYGATIWAEDLVFTPKPRSIRNLMQNAITPYNAIA